MLIETGQFIPEVMATTVFILFGLVVFRREKRGGILLNSVFDELFIVFFFGAIIAFILWRFVPDGEMYGNVPIYASLSASFILAIFRLFYRRYYLHGLAQENIRMAESLLNERLHTCKAARIVCSNGNMHLDIECLPFPAMRNIESILLPIASERKTYKHGASLVLFIAAALVFALTAIEIILSSTS
jgi:hypothetical protein